MPGDDISLAYEEPGLSLRGLGFSKKSDMNAPKSSLVIVTFPLVPHRRNRHCLRIGNFKQGHIAGRTKGND